MFHQYLTAALYIGAICVHCNPVRDIKDGNENIKDELKTVNDTITQRLLQLLDSISLQGDDKKVPRSFGGLPGTGLTIGAIDLAIQALGGEG